MQTIDENEDENLTVVCVLTPADQRRSLRCLKVWGLLRPLSGYVLEVAKEVVLNVPSDQFGSVRVYKLLVIFIQLYLHTNQHVHQLYNPLPVLETVPVRPRSAKRPRSTWSLSVVDSRCQSYLWAPPLSGHYRGIALRAIMGLHPTGVSGQRSIEKLGGRPTLLPFPFSFSPSLPTHLPFLAPPAFPPLRSRPLKHR